MSASSFSFLFTFIYSVTYSHSHKYSKCFAFIHFCRYSTPKVSTHISHTVILPKHKKACSGRLGYSKLKKKLLQTWPTFKQGWIRDQSSPAVASQEKNGVCAEEYHHIFYCTLVVIVIFLLLVKRSLVFLFCFGSSKCKGERSNSLCSSLGWIVCKSICAVPIYRGWKCERACIAVGMLIVEMYLDMTSWPCRERFKTNPRQVRSACLTHL